MFSSKKDRLEQLATALGREIPDAQEEFRRAVEYVEGDPKSAVTKVRIVLEYVLSDIYERVVGKQPRDDATIRWLLHEKKVKASIDDVIQHVQYVQYLSNRGPHKKRNKPVLSPTEADSAVTGLRCITEWYLKKYATELYESLPPSEDSSEFVIPPALIDAGRSIPDLFLSGVQVIRRRRSVAVVAASAVALVALLILIVTLASGPETGKTSFVAGQAAVGGTSAGIVLTESPLPETACRKSQSGRGGDMCRVPGGTFHRGCRPEARSGAGQHDTGCAVSEANSYRVTLDEFWLDRFEVTTDEFRQCVRSGSCLAIDMDTVEFGPRTRPLWARDSDCTLTLKNADQRPISCVTWHQSAAFCRWVGKRLPTEAEWELAAGGYQHRIFPWGATSFGQLQNAGIRTANVADRTYRRHYKDLDKYTDHYEDGFVGAAPIASFPSGVGPYGHQDLAGNVHEWCVDWFFRRRGEQDYSGLPEKNPRGANGPGAKPLKIIRGGGWNSRPKAVMARNRNWYHPDTRSPAIGFRCAR